MPITQIQNLYNLLQLDKKEDLELYRLKVLKASVQSQKENGFTWFPIRLRNYEVGMGDYLTLEIEKSISDTKPHQFNVGKSVEVFLNTTGTRLAAKGVVKAIHKNKMFIATTIDDVPDWFDEGKLGVSLLFDEYSYTEMEHVLKRLMKAENNRFAELRDVLYHKNEAYFNNKQFNLEAHNLNDVQKFAVQKCLQANDIAVIHGPPGTGKTTTLVALVAELLKTEKQILVCSPSNIAIDLLTEKISEKNIQVLRLGNPTRVSDNLLSRTLDGKISQHPQFKEIKNYRKMAQEYKSMARKYKRTFGRDEREQRNLLNAEAKNLTKEAVLLEDYIVKEQFATAQVICCTLLGAASYLLKNIKFNTVLIDEAAQALEPATYIAIEKANRVIFAGDHLQLPPTVKSKDAAKQGLAISLMEKCLTPQNNIMLQVQYRMNKHIMQFSNQQFYDGNLIAHSSVENRTLLSDENFISHQAFEYIDTAGCGFDEVLNIESLSVSNKDEALLLLKHLKLVLDELLVNKTTNINFTIAVISPYKEQVQLLTELIADDVKLKHYNNIRVKTIDGFQGQEKDIVYISLVRSNANGEIGFLHDKRRMNVALTRAKQKMVVVGDSATICSNSFYEKFVTFTQENGYYKSAWEFNVE